MTAEVEVNLYGAFRKYAPENKFSVGIDPGMSVATLLEKLNIPAEVYMMVLVNQLKVNLDHPLSPGDEVHVFQPVGGG